MVTPADCGNNFFVDQASMGKSRAETVKALLLEMNPHAEGHAVLENPHTLIDKDVSFFSKNFNMVLADSLREPQLKKLAAHLWEHNIPLVITRSYGFIGYTRLVFPEHCMIETHPPEVADLRLQNPWPELVQHVENFDFAFQNVPVEDRKMKHSHIPWLVLVLRFMAQYKKEHGGKECPKAEFGKYLLEQRYADEAGRKIHQENFDEAVKNVYRCYQNYSIPASVRACLNDGAASNLTPKSGRFWFLVSALKQFVEKEGEGKYLPLAGGLPDMHSDTTSFIGLQTIYQAKANSDIAAVTKYLNADIARVGAPLTFTHEEIQRFCKFSRDLRVQRCKSYAASISADSGEALSDRLNDEDQPEGRNVLWFLVLSAVAEFQAQHSRFPGEQDVDVAGDTPLLRAEFDKQAAIYGVKPSDEVAAVIDDHIVETVRYGGCEMHNIAAFMGGVVSLEIIKLVTGQWIPLSNTFIFNGINGTSIQLEL